MGTGAIAPNPLQRGRASKEERALLSDSGSQRRANSAELASGAPDYPDYAFIRYFREGYIEQPFRQAFIGTEEAITYAEAYLRTKALVWYFEHELSIGPDSVVALASENVVDLPIIMAAAQVCGAMLVLCSPRAELVEYEAYARHVNPDVYIVFRPDACDWLADKFPDMKIVTLRCKHEGYPSIEGAISENRVAGMAHEPTMKGEAHIVLFSSGSTGKPKAIVNRFSSFHHNGCIIAEGYRVTRDDVLYLPVPFFHSYGMIGLYTALPKGATIASIQKYHPESSLTLIETARVTVYFGVPTMYLREMRINEDDEWDLSSLRIAKIAGAPCPEAAAAEYERRYGCRMLPSYGMTEVAATTTMADYDAPLHVRAASVGKPIDGVQVKLDPETGELLCKSVAIMDGFLLDDGTLDPGVDEDGWFHSGDVAAQDEDGNYYITGRIKDIVIRGGVNIFPAEVENVYQQHEGVAESCMVGYPDPELGERTCLCVVEKEGHDESVVALRDYAKGRLEKCKIPDVVMKVDQLPRLTSGKTDKAALRKYVEQSIASSGRARSR